MENIMGTEIQGIQKMRYQETIWLSIQVHVLFLALYGHYLKGCGKVISVLLC